MENTLGEAVQTSECISTCLESRPVPGYPRERLIMSYLCFSLLCWAGQTRESGGNRPYFCVRLHCRFACAFAFALKPNFKVPFSIPIRHICLFYLQRIPYYGPQTITLSPLSTLLQWLKNIYNIVPDVSASSRRQYQMQTFVTRIT